jgi:hypothetical protein
LDGVLEAQQIVEITRERAGVSKKASNRVWVSGIRLIFGFLDETKFYKMVVFGKRTNTSTTWERFRAHYNKAMGSAVMSDKLSEIFTEALNDVQQLTTMKKLLNVTMGGRYDVAENFVDATVRTFRRGFTKKGRIDLERLEYLEGNITNERDHVMDILDAGSSDAMPEIFRQYLRSRFVCV